MKYSIFFLIIFAPFSAFTQTLSKSDIRPQAGETYIRHTADVADSMQTGQAGSSQVWDFSNVSFSAQNDHFFKILNPSSTPAHVPGATFVLMNYPMNDTLDKNYTYYRDTSDGYYELGDFQELAETVYSNLQFVYRFPLTYGSSTSDNFCFDLTIFSTTYTYCGDARLTFDGTGTLKLKGVSPIQDVIRLKLETTMLKKGSADSTYNTVYFWYKPGIHHPLAHYTIYREKSGYTSKRGFIYTTSNTLSVEPVRVADISVFPNPCNDELQIVSGNKIRNVLITGITGHKVMEVADIHATRYSLNTANLAPGVYFASVRTIGGVAVKKVMVGR